MSVSRIEEIDEEYENAEETVLERIIALQEMFPQPVQKGISTLTSVTTAALKFCAKYGSKAVWVIGSSALVLLLPAMYEESNDTALAQQEAQADNRRIQQQLLMGPEPRPGANIPGMPPSPQMG